jgi:hypothetical protein
MPAIKGRCHCGNISYVLESAYRPADFTPRACTCSFCTRHGGRYISDPAGQLEVSIADDRLVQHYRFGHETADFIVCRQCGVLTLVTSVIEGRRYAVININSADQHEDFAQPAIPVTYRDEPAEKRLARRARTWIGQVTI